MMLLLNKQTENTPIMSLQTGTKLGQTSTAIIDPRKLQVVAYYVAGPSVNRHSILHSSDIREFGPLGFIVNDADSIMELDDSLVRLQEVIDFSFELLGKVVVDDRKRRLGKITEYTLDSKSFIIQKLHVSQSIIKNISNSALIVHRSQIVEVTDRNIIVRSATVASQKSLAQVVNPFRKSQHLAPDAASHSSR